MDVILLTGGAGYIGSHVALELLDNGKRVVIIDNLSTGDTTLVPENVPFYEGDFSDIDLLTKVFKDHNVTSIMHFAALTDAAESLLKPIEYYRENTAKTLELLNFAHEHKVAHFLFSSSAAVYGNPGQPVVTEETNCTPLTPYGASKLMAERMIHDFAMHTPMHCGILRYFNVAGADPQGRAGQPNTSSPSLFSALCRTLLGLQESFTIFGNNYNTADGTCIRDFIHVSDLAAAHRLMLEHLEKIKGPVLLNCGYGHGHSVLELMTACEKVIGAPVPYKIGRRRDGDIEQIIASIDRLKSTLPWAPKYDDLKLMIDTSMKWERQKFERQRALLSKAS